MCQLTKFTLVSTDPSGSWQDAKTLPPGLWGLRPRISEAETSLKGHSDEGVFFCCFLHRVILRILSIVYTDEYCCIIVVQQHCSQEMITSSYEFISVQYWCND